MVDFRINITLLNCRRGNTPAKTPRFPTLSALGRDSEIALGRDSEIALGRDSEIAPTEEM